MLITSRLFIFITIQLVIVTGFVLYHLNFLKYYEPIPTLLTRENKTTPIFEKELPIIGQKVSTDSVEIDWNLLHQLESYSSQRVIDTLMHQSNNTPLDPVVFSSTLQCQSRELKNQLERDFNYWFHSNPQISEELFKEERNPLFLIHSQKLYILKKDISVKSHFKAILQLLNLLLKTVKLDNVIFSVSLHDGKSSMLHNSFPTLTATKTVGGEFLIPNFQDINRLLNVPFPLAENLKFLKEKTITSEDFWKTRKNVAFWRGGNSGPYFQSLQYGTFPRYRLVELSKHNPGIIDAGFSHYYPNIPAEKREEIIKYYGTVPYVKYSEAFYRYNYIISVDGNSAAWRVSTLLASPSVLLKQSSIHSEHFYANLEPWKHFVPLEMDLSNLVETVHFLNANPDKAKMIVNNQMKFAQQYLLMEGMLCYMYNLLNGLAIRQKIFNLDKYVDNKLEYKFQNDF